MIADLPRLELPLHRRVRLRRPEDWVPRWGERVMFVRGGDYLSRTVRILAIPAGEGRHGIQLDRLIGSAPIERLWPLPNWRETREREDRECSDPEEVECPF